MANNYSNNTKITAITRIGIRMGIRTKVREVTLDMAANMGLIVGRCFPKASKVIDRFHVQNRTADAASLRRCPGNQDITPLTGLDQENLAIEVAGQSGMAYQPEVLVNGDTLKQLLVRSRYLLFKHHDKWAASQVQRSRLLFERYPLIEQAYKLALSRHPQLLHQQKYECLSRVV